MSSDYIPRLRAELLRAGARGRTRRRVAVALRPVAALGATAVLVAAVLILLPGPSSDERPAFGYRSAEAAAAAPILRARLAAAGIAPAQVTTSGDRVQVVVPPDARGVLPSLLQPGRFAIYDWEASRVGGSEPVSASVARARAASSSHAIAVRTDEGKWYALAGVPPIGNADVAGTRVATDPSSGEPVVVVSLTAAGRRTFAVVTRELARRGADQALGGDPLQTSQHLAIVVDDRLLSLPYVNWRTNPDGLDGDVQIAGGLTPGSARVLAAVLRAGPLPALSSG